MIKYYKELIILNLLSMSVNCHSQKVLFLHHSTGGNVFTEGKVASWVENYNIINDKSYVVEEIAYPNTPYPWNNYPFDFWNLWIKKTCNNEFDNIRCLDSLCAVNDVIIFKHCFPGASIQSDEPTSTVESSNRTLGNYKLQYRALRELMDDYPNNKFIVWTLAPQHRLATNKEQASRAGEFVDWVKNLWLIEDEKYHPNIFIFDFFGLVAEKSPSPINGQQNCLKYEYERSHTNSDAHPNKLANETVGPVFAQFIINSIESQTVILVNDIAIESVNGDSIIETIGGTIELIASIVPFNATNKTVTWSLQNGTGKATITSQGTVTGLSNGTVIVKATANDGSGISDSLLITIDIKSKVNEYISYDELSLKHIDDVISILFNNCDHYYLFELYHLNGSLIFRKEIENSESIIDTPQLSSGIYILALHNFNGKITTFKVIKP